jgi:oxygen-dependent protoporphyrinogen oxidase
MNEKRYHITIIGGGITGLTSAFYLMREREAHNLPIDFTLIEESNRLGGKIATWRHDGFVIELGPDSFLERKASAGQLIHDVGLQDDLVRNATGQAYILHKNRLMPIPEGAVMGIPTKLMPFVTTSLISPLGKLRAALDLVLPAGNHGEDEAVGHFFRRRLGDEVIDNLIEPLLSGVYGGNIDEMSLQATFPQFARMEQKYRSLILAMKSTRPPSNKQEKQGMFQTLRGGLQSLVERMESLLPPASIVKNGTVERVEKKVDRYELHLGDGQVIDTDAIIMTVPHANAQKMLRTYVDIPPLAGTTPTTVATVALAYPAEQVKLHLEGTGFVVPRKSDFTITACTWTHRKWPHTTPQGKALLRCFVGRENDQAIVGQSDEEIVRVAVKDLQRIIQVGDTPEFYMVNRIQRSIPYVVGHQQWLRSITEKVKAELPGVFLAGASYAGVGLPDCIDQGKKAVHDVLQHVTNK